MQGVIIAGTYSGCGKTTITLGMLAALKKIGLTVQSFKAGPDFIDTGLHKMITGRPSRNLDLWMCGEDYVKACFYKHSTGVDISIIEGVMGLYDGDLSTAKLAEVLNLPVVLIVDAYGMAESAGAVVKGFLEYGAEVQKSRRAEAVASEPYNFRTYGLIAGVIFNRVASERHYERLIAAVKDIPVMGYLPRDLKFQIPHRHLGLVVAEENPIAEDDIERLADAILKHVNIEEILRFRSLDQKPESNVNPQIHGHQTPSIKIGIAYDRAFCFYYEDNLDLLKEAGAELITFSPLYDSKLPENIDAIYIGGGYPELYAFELSKNKAMLDAIYNRADSGMPIYAECGGLMYLSQGIYDLDGNFFKLAGIIPFETIMKKGTSRLGYRSVQLNEDCILGRKGDNIKGHEFHYSEIKEGSIWQCSSAKNVAFTDKVYSVRNNQGESVEASGYRFKNVLASYIHTHFGSSNIIAKNFINFIKECRWKT